MCVCVRAQSCPTLCDPMDCSLPGSSVHGILQARILEWVTISFSKGSSHGSNPYLLRHLHWQYSLPAEPPKKPSAADVISVSNGRADFSLSPSSCKEAFTPPLKTWIQALLKTVSCHFEQCLTIDFN